MQEAITRSQEGDNTATPKRIDRIKNRLETNNTLILAIATLTITWCSYQSTLWDGIQTFRLVHAMNYNRLAQEKASMVGQRTEIDAKVLIDFMNEVYNHQTDRIRFYLARVRPELRKVMEQWILSDPLRNTAAPPHPMSTKEYEELIEKEMTESRNLTKKGDEYYAAAEEANTVSDRYALYTVILSMVMFIGALTTRLTQPRLSFLLILVSGAICLVILIFLFYSMPLAKE